MKNVYLCADYLTFHYTIIYKGGVLINSLYYKCMLNFYWKKSDKLFAMKLFVCLMFLSGCFHASATLQPDRTVNELQQEKKIKIKGTVIDDTGETQPGVTVMIKGTKVGTVTDIDGNYEIMVEPTAQTLLFSLIGMKKEEVPIKGRTTINVTMAPDVQMISEVVVTGMTKVDKRLFTGASDKLSGDKARIDGLVDVSRSLEGRSAGVTVQNVSGTFGSAPKIRIRGATSIYGNSKPLWVVDGVIIEDAINVTSDDLTSGNAETLISSAIAGLNADDIESFQILKDGSATSIYGARAMAGVIVITTKKGKAGSSRINYTGEFTSRTIPSYNDFNISNSQQQMGIYQEMERKGWLEFTTLSSASNSGVYGKMYQQINTRNADGTYALQNTDAAKNSFLQRYEYLNTDWFDLLFSNNISQNHAVSISSGTDKARFYASMSLYNDPGWTVSSSVDRYTLNLNGSFNLSETLTLNLIGNGSYRDQKAPGTLSQETDIVRGEVKRDFDINPYSFAINSSRALDPNEYYIRNYAPFNIFHELENNYIDLNITETKFQGELAWKPLSGLEITGLAAMRYNTSSQEHHIKDFSNQAMAYRAGITPEDPTIAEKNPLLYTDPDNPKALPISVLPKGGIYNRTENTMKSTTFRISGLYNKMFNNTHILNLFATYERNAIDRNRTWFRGWGMQYSNGEIPFIDYNVFKQSKEENTSYYSSVWGYTRNEAYAGTATYSYKSRYTINGTLRYEGTNKLGKSKQARWLPTWNIAGSWRASEESWFNGVFSPVVSNMLFKMSYSLTATTGPDFVNNTDAMFESYTPWRPVASASEPGLQFVSPANSDLTYEKKYEYNVGTELGFLNDRITLSMDYYIRRNFNLIGIVYTQGTGGFPDVYANSADMDASGLEVSLSTRNIVTKDFSWNTDVIFANATNEISKLNTKINVMSLVSGISNYGKTGYPVRPIFSIPFVGLNEDGLPMFMNQDGEVTVTDIDFQNYENQDFLKYEGPSEPTLTGSFGNLFKWKNLSLNVFITYSFGNKIRLYPYFRSSYSDLSSLPKEFENRWVLPGDEQYTSVPVIASRRQVQANSQLSYAYNAYNYSTERIADGGFIRMKEISLAYDFRKEIVNALRLNSLQLKLQATNPFLIYADKKLNGQDPEFYNSGGVASPLPKQYTLTVRFGI